MTELTSQEKLNQYNKEQEDYLERNSRIKKHIQEIKVWLDQNVEQHPACTNITLSDFKVKVLRQEIEGSFNLLFGEFKCAHRINFSFGENGKASMGMPMFHSPLGAPCSYGAIDIDHTERQAINHALNYIFPRLKPYGLDRETGSHIQLGTPVINRMVDANGFINAKGKVQSSNYTITVKLDDKEIQESSYETSKPIW